MDSIEIKTTKLEDYYRIFWSDKIGSGANGNVYSCLCKKTWKNYAVKIIPDRPRARREIEMQMACQSSRYVVPIFDVYSNSCEKLNKNKRNKYIFIIMENMRGGELFSLIENHSDVLNEAHWCKIIKQIVLGLKDIHELGIIHRDLKPENIFIKDDYSINQFSSVDETVNDMEIMIGDFGFAVEAHTRPCEALFTPYYVAPEILANDLRYRDESEDKLQTPYDSRCDMWSLGVVMYALISNIPPFYPEIHSKTMTKRMYNNILTGTFHFQYNIWKSISYEVKELISDLVQVNPDDRVTMEEVMQHSWFKNMGNAFESEQSTLSEVSLGGLCGIHDKMLKSGSHTDSETKEYNFSWIASSSNDSESSDVEFTDNGKYTVRLIIQLDNTWAQRRLPIIH
ncbi:MK-5 type 3 [Oopsacas minuta]|uniref:MK-5 type 3 n=1 Tax=Oopsacas minuta TaxID=111878 RepID=A0AAV7K9A1_9METZ|nr:MK-5 type 3 [Oopsacas minuta]